MIWKPISATTCVCVFLSSPGPEISGRPNNSLSSLVDLKTGRNQPSSLSSSSLLYWAGRRLVKKSFDLLSLAFIGSKTGCASSYLRFLFFLSYSFLRGSSLSSFLIESMFVSSMSARHFLLDPEPLDCVTAKGNTRDWRKKKEKRTSFLFWVVTTCLVRFLTSKVPNNNNNN